MSTTISFRHSADHVIAKIEGARHGYYVGLWDNSGRFGNLTGLLKTYEEAVAARDAYNASVI